MIPITIAIMANRYANRPDPDLFCSSRQCTAAQNRGGSDYQCKPTNHRSLLFKVNRAKKAIPLGTFLKKSD